MEGMGIDCDAKATEAGGGEKLGAKMKVCLTGCGKVEGCDWGWSVYQSQHCGLSLATFTSCIRNRVCNFRRHFFMLGRKLQLALIKSWSCQNIYKVEALMQCFLTINFHTSIAGTLQPWRLESRNNCFSEVWGRSTEYSVPCVVFITILRQTGLSERTGIMRKDMAIL